MEKIGNGDFEYAASLKDRRSAALSRAPTIEVVLIKPRPLSTSAKPRAL